MKGLNRLGDIEVIPPATIRQIVVNEVGHPDADSIFISSTGMRTADILEAMEEAAGNPVVTANQPTVWDLLRLAGTPIELAPLASA